MLHASRPHPHNRISLLSRLFHQYPQVMKKSSIDVWVFDLDNTLYPPSARLFDQIEAKMEGYIIRELGMTRADAKAMRADFWHNHGTTLEGLVKTYGIDPEPFLEEVHDIDHAILSKSAPLREALLSLNGRRLIYTNGSRKHGEQVSDALGIRDCFETIYGIEDAGYRPKPHADAFAKVFQKAGFDPKRAIMFEDDPRNLQVPYRLGMQTVLVGSDLKDDHIGHNTHDLAAFLTAL